jgi:hypothetical protein
LGGTPDTTSLTHSCETIFVKPGDHQHPDVVYERILNLSMVKYRFYDSLMISNLTRGILPTALLMPL